MGRPTIYTAELGEEICRRLVSGMSLRAICDADDMPHRDTVATWALDITHPFSVHYTRAREIQAELMSDEILEIADESDRDYKIVGVEGDKVVDNEAIQRSRLRVDTRKWYLSKVLPKKYGEKTVVENTHKYDLSNLSTEDLQALKAIHAKLDTSAP
jgi:hypothetical protein